MCSCNVSNPNTTCSNCATNTCSGCTYTLNTDCVIYNKAKLDFEAGNVLDNSSRTLTSVIQSMESLQQGLLQSKFHALSDGGFTLDANDFDKVHFLDDPDSSTGVNVVITLPTNSLDFAGKVFTFINRTPVASGAWSFNTPIIVDYDPLTTQTAYNSIVTAGTKVLKLAFLQTTQTSWGWFVIS